MKFHLYSTITSEVSDATWGFYWAMSFDNWIFHIAGWQKAAQAMETLALIMIGIVLVLCVYRVLHSKPGDAIPHMIGNFSAGKYYVPYIIIHLGSMSMPQIKDLRW